MNQLDLMQWDRPEAESSDPRTWERRIFRKDGAHIEVKMTEDTNYRGWYDVVFRCYDSAAMRRLLYRGEVKAGWDEVQVYVDHWFRPLTEGRVPRGVPLYKLSEVRGEEVDKERGMKASRACNREFESERVIDV